MLFRSDEAAGRCCLIGLQVLIKQLTGADHFIDLHLAVQLFQHHLQSVAGGDGGINKRILIAYICQQIVYYEEMMIITMNGNSFKILEAGEGRKEELLVFCYESKLVFTVYMYYLLLH